MIKEDRFEFVRLMHDTMCDMNNEDAYFIKVREIWIKTSFALEVYVYSYTFEEEESMEADSEGESADSSEENIPVQPTVGFKYEKEGRDSYRRRWRGA